MSLSSFVNPYNFIPFGAKAPARTSAGKGTYTGVIKYTLLTKTPLVIPNTSNEDAFCMGVEDHKSYDFFSYNDLGDVTGSVADKYFEPVIPGSEMRGMIRSNYEIITNSCLSAVDDDDVLSKHTNETFKPGLLKKTGDNSYELYKAEDHLLRTEGENNLEPDASSWDRGDSDPIYGRKCFSQSELTEGQRVRFGFRNNGRGKKIITDINTGNCTEEGYVIKGEEGPEMIDKKTKKPKKNNKHCCHIFKLLNRVRELNDTDMASLTAVLKAYKENKVSPYEEYARNLEEFKKGPKGAFYPVYYSSASDNNEYIMLSPACITREIYHAKIRDMLGAHKTCNDKNSLCPACALFGTIGKGSDKKVFQVASRLRFSDLYLGEKDKEKYNSDSKSVYDENDEKRTLRTLRPLSNPRLNNMEFYLKQPEGAWFWTYDYYVDSEGKVHYETGELNGRKFYWHDLNPDLTDQEPTNLNTTVRPVKKDTMFCGNVYFEKVTKKELDELIFTLMSGDDEDVETKKHGYKLGHAKPLGFGSVAIAIDSVTLVSFELNDAEKTVDLQEKPYEDYSEPDFESDIRRDFEIMTNFDTVSGKNVLYPIPREPESDGSRPIFKWFAENHSGYDHRKSREIAMPNSRKQMVFRKHMVAMNPELQSTGYSGGTANNTGGGNGGSSKRDEQRGQRNSIEYEIGKEYEGTVTGYNDKKTSVYIRLKNGGSASLFYKDIGAEKGRVDEKMPHGENVSVTYMGQEKGYDNKYHDKWKKSNE